MFVRGEADIDRMQRVPFRVREEELVGRSGIIGDVANRYLPANACLPVYVLTQLQQDGTPRCGGSASWHEWDR